MLRREILRPDGSISGDSGPVLSIQETLDALERMLLSKRIDERAFSLQRQGGWERTPRFADRRRPSSGAVWRWIRPSTGSFPSTASCLHCCATVCRSRDSCRTGRQLRGCADSGRSESAPSADRSRRATPARSGPGLGPTAAGRSGCCHDVHRRWRVVRR